MTTMKKIPRILIVIGLLVALGLGVWNLDVLSWNKKPIDGNVLHLPYGASWDDTNTMTSPWKNLQFHTALMFRSLFIADSSLENVEPDMVESYAVLDKGMKYQFTLKNDLLWSDSKPITADDVAFSMEAVLMADDSNGLYPAAFSAIQGADAFIAGDAEHISGIEVTGNTITVEMERVYPSFLQVLAQFVILPKHCLEDEDLATLYLNKFWCDPVVSGMYEFGEVVPYEYVQLVRNPYYVGTAPKIDEVYIQLNHKRVDLDYHTTANSTEIINYRSMRAMEEYQVDSLFYRYLVFNLQGSETNENIAIQDPMLREAVSYAIDIDKLLKDIYFDFGSPIDYGVPRSSDNYNHVAKEYNPEKAKSLLAESDYDMERPLRLAYYHTDSVTKYLMETIANQLREVGFNVDLRRLETPADLYEIREYDILLKGLSAFSLNEWYAEYAPTCPTLSKLFGVNTTFEPLVKQLSSAVDEDIIHDTLQHLQELEQKQLYKLPLFTLSQMVYVRSDRVCIPENVVFGNTWYKYDVDFEDWYIKTA